jgi:hypothetical protein
MNCPNVKECSCPETQCPNHARCCACVLNHKNGKAAPYCLRKNFEKRNESGDRRLP